MRLIDRPKARILVDWTRDLTPRHTARALSELLPVAPRLTTGQLVDRLRRWLKSLDPEALRKRYERAVRSRTVIGYLHRDGTATIRASGLSPAEAASSCERVWELARTIRRGGHPGTQGQIRTDLFVALLDGSLQQMTTAQIVAAMLARCSSPIPGSDPAAGSAPGQEGRPGIDVRVRISTLLGLDELPGEIPGWGVILPQPARDAVARQRAGRWRFAIADAEGNLLLAGVTRRRPASGEDGRQNVGGTVELQVPLPLAHRRSRPLPSSPATGRPSDPHPRHLLSRRASRSSRRCAACLRRR